MRRVFFLVLLLPYCLGANSVNLIAKDSLSLGDIIHYKVSLDTKNEKNLVLPNLDTIRQIAVLDIDKSVLKEQLELDYKILFLATGLVSIPPVKFSYTSKDDKAIEFITQEAVFVIHSLLDSSDTDIGDIAPLTSVRLKIWDYLLPLSIIVLLLLAIYFLQKFKNGETIFKKNKFIDLRPAWKVGMDELKKAKPFLQKGELLEYYFLLSTALRSFLGKEFDVLALLMTTIELKSSLEIKNIKFRRSIFEILDYADMVKFAKFISDIETSKEYYQKTKELFEESKKEAQRKAKLQQDSQENKK